MTGSVRWRSFERRAGTREAEDDMLVAVTREVSPGIGRCELTHLDRTPIDSGLARTQHRTYVNCLSELGFVLVRLAADAELPDSVFVEDTCVVFDETAVLARPGAASRRREVEPIAQILGWFRDLCSIESPGTLDGGDVLTLGRTVYVGMSRRTNRSRLRYTRFTSKLAVKVEVHKVHLEAGDAVLLCSDGLTEMLPEEEIARVLQAEAEPEQGCRQLVACANEAGGRDNITVVVAQFRDTTQEVTSARGQESRRQRIGRAESVAPAVFSPTGQGAVRPSQPVPASPRSG